jgi:ligand-binding sensor domain-containing protein/anti-sigma regulatory factor (Ser/Thr protein kinase)
MRYFPVCFLVLLYLSVTQAYGQKEALLFQRLTLEDGLTELTNQFVYKDSRGFIWISSVNGLNRFDGNGIRNYLPDPTDSTSIYRGIIQSNFFEDSAAHIWFSTWEGINCYEREYDRFHHYSRDDQEKQKVQGYIIFHQDSLHQLWLISEDSLIYTFNVVNKEFVYRCSLKLESQRAIALTDHKNNVRRIYTYKTGHPGVEQIIFKTDGTIEKNTILFAPPDALQINPKKIIQESDSLLWIAATDHLIRYNIYTKSISTTTIDNILSFESFNDSTFLVSIDGLGINEFNKNTFSFGHQYLTESNNSLSLLSNRIDYISTDRDRGIWLSSEGIGLSYASPGKVKFKLYNPLSGQSKEKTSFSVNGIVRASPESVFCSTEKGGLFLMNQRGQIMRKIEGNDSEGTSRLKTIHKIWNDTQNHIWLSTDLGVSVFSNDGNVIQHVTDQANRFILGIRLSNGRIYLARVSGGIWEAINENNIFRFQNVEPQKFFKEYLPLKQDAEGRMWMSEELVKMIVVDTALNKIADLPIAGFCTQMVETDDGTTAWIASSMGLYQVDTRAMDICKIYTEEKGLPFTGINSMLPDNQGRFWMTSNTGLIVFDPKTSSSHLYTYADGLPASKFNLYAAYKFPDGEMWFGSSKGITAFYPDQIRDISIEAIPQITSLLVNGHLPERKLICENTHFTNITEIEKLRFTYKENTLTFLLNSLEYSAPERNKVKYIMQNFDKEWEETEAGSEVRYHLSPGKYSLLVQASNSDGIYSPFIKKLDLVITPPFYQTWWFYVLVFLSASGLVIYIVYLNFSKRLELQNVRLRLYENLHDDVGSRLTSIAMSSEELLRQDTAANPRLEQIARTSKSIVGNMRRLVWAIDPENDSMTSLLQKIQYDKSFILGDDIDFRLDMDPGLRQMTLPGEIRYQITSIINEALNNINKYAKAKHVAIHFWKKPHELNMSIRDDGIGFNMEETKRDKLKSSGYGLGNMEKRISRVKGKLEIRSSSGEGTQIEVSIPIK